MTEFQSKMIVVVALGFVATTAALMRADIAVIPAALLSLIAAAEYRRADQSLWNFFRYRLFAKTPPESRQPQ